MFLEKINKLCTPSYVYLVISSITLIALAIQNSGSNTTYCAGSYNCQTSNVVLLFLIKIIYVAFWTWILNLICKMGSPVISWALVLAPFILMFIFIAVYIFFSARDIPITRYTSF